MLRFWTAQYRYPGPHRLDITVKGQDPVGKEFAPTWQMVKDYKAGFISEDVARQVYVDKYHEMMLDSLKDRMPTWLSLLEREYAVLVCFCRADAFCHRTLLAHYLQYYGGKYMGEIKDFKNLPQELL